MRNNSTGHDAVKEAISELIYQFAQSQPESNDNILKIIIKDQEFGVPIHFLSCKTCNLHMICSHEIIE